MLPTQHEFHYLYVQICQLKFQVSQFTTNLHQKFHKYQYERSKNNEHVQLR